MAKRQKKVVITDVTREQADEAFAQYAKAEAQIQKINAEIELQCAKTREKYADKLAILAKEKDEAFNTLDSYASENKAELFAKKKSLEMTHGTIGYRTGTPKLKTLKGFTWESAKNLVKEFLPSYIRQTEEIAKDRILADRDMEHVDVRDHDTVAGPMRLYMEKCGIQVVQEETFYVEPKKEDSE
ncbi:MAG: host-nuclease inhibitor Gam family protein [Prevotella sp.]|nr:host-nuclease inhibitor Gam family protein [Prevotella sp.]